jgi:peptide/nickel transport system substrate-binding protein
MRKPFGLPEKHPHFHVILFVATVAASLLNSCQPQRTPSPAPQTRPPATAIPILPPHTAVIPSPRPESDEHLFVYLSATTFPSLDPSISFSNDSAVLSNAYETLTFYNPPGSDLVLSPGLATRWESNADATEWIFYLRRGVIFQDGANFNAAAVKYSIERTISLGQGAAFIWDSIEQIEIMDDYTIRFKLKYSAPLDLIAAAGYAAWIFSPATVEAQGEKASDWFDQGHSAGTGPYWVESVEPGTRVTMTRFDGYWGGWKKDQFDKIIFEIVVDVAIRQHMIEVGAADFAYDLPRENWATLDAQEGIAVSITPSFQNLLGLFNTKKEPTNNRQIRQALAYAFPYQEFIEDVMLGQALQSYGPVPAGMWGHSESLFQYGYDLEKARELLAQVGYPQGGFDLALSYNVGDRDQQRAGELWKTELAKLGINLQLWPMEWEPQWDLARADPTQAQDILVMYWWPTWITPYDFLFNMFHCEDSVAFNLGYYCNAEFDEAIDRANQLSGSDRAQAEQLFVAAQQMLIEDAAAIFFYDRPNNRILRSDIRGYTDNPAYPYVVFVYKLWREP